MVSVNCRNSYFMRFNSKYFVHRRSRNYTFSSNLVHQNIHGLCTSRLFRIKNTVLFTIHYYYYFLFFWGGGYLNRLHVSRPPVCIKLVQVSESSENILFVLKIQIFPGSAKVRSQGGDPDQDPVDHLRIKMIMYASGF